MKPAENDIPPVVTKRNEFGSIPLLIEDTLDSYPEEGRVITRTQMSQILTQWAERISHQCEMAFSKGAERGIEQARRLMIDPDYYVAVKQRRTRANQRYKDDQEQQRIERLERESDPEWRAKHIVDLRKWIDESKNHSAQLEAKLTAFLARCDEPVKLVRIPISEKTGRLPGEKADVLPFKESE